MKIVCDGCSTRYSVSDDKLVGKVFKIRCKRCSHVIVVRGVEAAAAELPAAAGEWYFVIDGHQFGPHERSELERRRAAGELDAETYVWREGFAEWQTLGSLSEVHGSIEPEPRLRAERNETSVLFTLGSLAKLAAPASPPAVAATAPGSEGSGLIDIRALRASLATAATRPSSAGASEELAVLQSAAFVDVGVLVPTARRDRRLVVALVALVGALAIAAAVLLVLVLRDDAPAVAEAAAAPRIAVPPPMVAAAAPRVAAPAAPPAVAALPPPVGAAPPPPGRAAAPRTPRAVPRPARTAELPAPPPERRPPPPPAEACSEITCIVNGNADPCCQARMRVPERLDRPAIAAGITTIRTASCPLARRTDVKLSLKVSPSGEVTGATVISAGDPAVGACVAAAARDGTFARTQRGGTFGYTWHL